MTSSRPDASHAALATLALLAFVAAWALMHAGWYTRNQIRDTPIYQSYGEAMEHGQVPYRDFSVEYPPGALPVFVLPALLSRDGDERSFRRAFEPLMAAAGMAAVLLVVLTLNELRAPWRRVLAAALIVALAPLALGSVVLSRFDLFAAAVTAAALAALVGRRTRLAALLLGFAIAVKLYPAVLLPLAAVYAWRTRGRREGWLTATLALAVVSLSYLPFVVLSPGGVAHSVWRQLGRPLQIESLGSAVLLALHQAGMPLGWDSSHGSQNLTGTGAAVAAVLLTLAQVAVLVWLWVDFARGPAEPERLLRYSAAALVAFVALGKVLSPQFLIWLVPVVVLVRGRRGLVASGLLLVACVLTQIWFPFRYWRLVYDFDALTSWLVLARDLVLVALLVVLVRAREPGAARSP